MSAEQQIEKLAIELAAAKRKIESLEREKRKVGISFHRVPESGYQIKRLWDEDFPYLQPIPRLSYTHADRVADHGTDALAKTDGNITLIEGENLAVLVALQLTHKENVDVIYIDPPYNTGNNDFIYNDARKSSLKDVVDDNGLPVTGKEYETRLDGKARTVGRDDPEKHSLWLSFMEKRLTLAKELLTEDGAIFISIDDNEQARLKLLMDSIFGEENFVSLLVWAGKTGGADDRHYATKQEYILVYAKNHSLFIPGRKASTDAYNLTDPLHGRYKQQLLRKWGSNSNRSDRPRMFYPITAPDGSELYPLHADGKEGCWRWGRSTMDQVLKLSPERISFKKDSANNWIAYENIYEKDNQGKTVPYNSSIDATVAVTATGTKELKNILGPNIFPYPKSTQLLSEIIRRATQKKDMTVLDFFAGSGTTAQAVAELNAEDNGTRQAILVTHGDENGKNIAEDITAERIRRVLSGKNWDDGEDHPQLPGDLTYMKLLYTPKTSNPLTAVEIMQTKFIGLASLEQEVTISNVTENYAILENSHKLVVVLTNQDYLEYGADEISEGLNHLALTYSEKDTYVLYIPTTENFDEYGIELNSDKWQKVCYPTEYIRKHKDLIELMKKRKLLLQPLNQEPKTTEETV